MKRVLLVAKTEALEHRRQPSMVMVLVANYVFWNSAFVVVMVLLNSTRDNPQVMSLLDKQVLEMGICSGESALKAFVKIACSTFGAVMFTTMPLFVAIFSGFSILNDRINGTMPFLMLAPLSRYQFLLGKVLGALALPFLLHVIFVGLTSWAVRGLEIMEPFSDQFGGSSAWWVAFLLGAPAASLLVGALGTVISGLSKDVRTSMQFTSFLIGILSLAVGHLLFDRISSGVGVQLMVAVGALIGGLLVLFVGSKIISRDIA